ncbi:MAG: AI-2E family transporter [Candidatus Pacebacteria bacterium]|nr:AI-2E family transporter [Candidatus Paceibacterota bacterium]
MKVPSKDTIISISTGTIVKGLAIIVAFLALWTLRSLVLIVLTSVVLASSMDPAIKFLERHRVHRIPAVILVYLSLVGIFIGMFFAFVPPLVGEVYEVSTNFPAIAKEINESIFSGDTATITKGQALIDQVAKGAPAQDLFLSISNIYSASESFNGFVSSVFGGLFSFVLIIVLSFYFAMLDHEIESFFKIFIPTGKQDYAISLWERTKNKIGKWMQGQLLLGVMIFILVYMGLTIFRVPYALLLALFAGIMEVIPVFGPIISAIPPILLSFSIGGMTQALIMMLFFIVVQQFESHLIYPLVVRKVIGVPPILVILSLIVGFELAGVLGVIIAVPVAASMMELVLDLEKKKALV